MDAAKLPKHNTKMEVKKEENAANTAPIVKYKRKNLLDGKYQVGEGNFNLLIIR